MSTLRSIDEIVAVVDAVGSTGRVVVGIVGPPGSGKSTVAEALVARFASRRVADRAALLPMDGFHLPQARLVELGRRDRMGAADTFDVDGFLEVLRAVRAGDRDVAAPGFDRTIEEPVAGALTLPASTRLVIVEGNYLLHDAGGWQHVAPLLDLTLYVDVDDELRLRRLIDRHVRFGKTPDAARAWALGPDEANARVIAAGRDRADHLIALG